MLSFEILEDSGIVLVEPSGPLQEQDFAELTSAVDAYLEENEELRGLLIHAKSFPGWEDFGAAAGHLRFVRDHHRKIRRIAVVTDGKLISLLPRLVDHFVAAEIKSFEYDCLEQAKRWLVSEP